MRIGLGFDVHKLVVGRKLVLGGLQFPTKKDYWGTRMPMYWFMQ
jgi:2C-methyl-D-erythritol 2,4-cyclodiphosphate synthase